MHVYNEPTAQLQEQKMSSRISWRIRTQCHLRTDQDFPFVAVNFFLFLKAAVVFITMTYTVQNQISLLIIWAIKKLSGAESYLRLTTFPAIPEIPRQKPISAPCPLLYESCPHLALYF
jgi:hypothetical protein